MKNKKWVMLVAAVVIIFSVLILVLGVQHINTAKILEEHSFSLTNSLPVGETVDFSSFKNKDFVKLFQNNKSKVVVFGRKECAACSYLSFPLKEWIKEYKNLDFIYIEMTGLEIHYLDTNSKNFHLILNDPNKSPNLTDLFHVKFSPTIFFLNNNNKIIWKRCGFLITDYVDLSQHLNEFAHGQVKFTDYQRNIVVGKELPSIQYIYNGKKIIIPDELKGKPTFIYLFMSTCGACKNALDQIPKSIASNNDVRKLIIFAGFNKVAENYALSFANHFSMKLLENEIKQNAGYEELSYDYLLRKTLDNYKNVVIVRDDFFRLQNMLGLPGAPFLIALDKDGKVIGVYSIASKNKEISSAVLKILLERR